MNDNLKLLVVDDIKEVRLSVVWPLETDFQVVEADSGENALQIIRADRKIKLVFLDMAMPGLDGLSTLAKIKEYNPHIEVCILSGETNHGKMETAKMLGAFDYLIKPCDIDIIMQTAKEMAKRVEEKKSNFFIFNILKKL